MKMKRFLCALLALVLTVGLLPASVGAVNTGFPDITDADTARNVEILRMMGVVDGMGNGTFQPAGKLTRAQFCKMAITLMGKADAASSYKDFTIFPDVRGSHWAAGYINLAVRGETKLLSGYPNGTFGPDNLVTYADAVTILMRLLGYADTDVGAVWPDGYLNTAATIGLTAGLKLSASTSITRAQAAKLFVNLLDTPLKGGASTYMESISGSIVKDVVLLSVDAKADDGTEHTMLTSNGNYKYAKNQASTVLEGAKGSLVLDKDGKVLTFVPNRGGSYKTVTVSVAKSEYLQDSTGAKHNITAKTTVYFDGKTTTYAEIFKSLRTGSVATIYYNANGVSDYIFVSATASTEAVIIDRNGSTTNLAQLTDGASYSIYKNGAKITAAELRQYDVATYDPATKIVHVCDTRLTGCYEDVSPNLEAPSSVTVMGVSFTVLPSAVSDLAQFKIGNTITLLLTRDNQVAGAMAPSSAVQSNAAGIVTSVSENAATVELFNGLTVSGDPNLRATTVSSYIGQIVSVSSPRQGQLSLTRLSGSSSTGNFNVAQRTIGSTMLADNVQIFEKVGQSGLTQIAYGDLTQSVVRSSSIAYVEKDYTNKIKIVVLEDVTGSCYTYGVVKRHETPHSSELGTISTNTLSVEYAEGKATTPINYATNFKDGSFAGIVLVADGSAIEKVIELKKVSSVAFSAWNGADSVTVQGVTYPMAENLQCYNATTKAWISLEAARAFATTADLYYDRDISDGGKVRIVVVTQ